ncbi:Hypothetical predicted protein [Cloeon dipterum]|uniref:peptidylprolyl isomerase n=1 Tax=Cloeon dipterum TaxID=197152 RepID=A0A8S1DHV1_9INSE|nr:Hypothetical predicted protein [Cloeon dipterum]
MSSDKEKENDNKCDLMDLSAFDPLANVEVKVEQQELDDFFALNVEKNGIKLCELQAAAENNGHVVFETVSKEFDSSSEDEGNGSFDEDEVPHSNEQRRQSAKKLFPKPQEFIPSFDELVKKMHPIREDGKIMKRVLLEGCGELVPENAFVSFHYNAYRDNEDESFDSTWLRRYPWKVRLEDGILTGLKEALMSMKKNERSQFLLHPDLMYGPNGCPPRIPANAHLMYEITLEDVIEGEVASMMEDQNQSTADFKVLLKAVDREHAEGVQFFKNQSYISAIGCFKRAVRRLENFTKIKNRQDSEEQMKKLQTLFVNLAVCHNSLGEPEKACSMCQEALKIEPQSCKANFHYGRALATLGDFEGATRRLTKAKWKNPCDETINLELKKVQEKKELAKQKEKDMAKFMFQGSTGKKAETEGHCGFQKKPLVAEKEDFDPVKKSMSLRLDKFVADKRAKQIHLPLVLNDSDVGKLQKLAHERNLGFSITGQNIFTISKLDNAMKEGSK